MLHIILGILKIIGILLAILLLLLLAVFLAVLFVPVRYQGRLKTGGEGLSGGIKLTWLMHFLAAEATLDSLGRGKPKLEIRIFGISLEKITGFLSRRKGRKKRGASRLSSAESASGEGGASSSDQKERYVPAAAPDAADDSPGPESAAGKGVPLSEGREADASDPVLVSGHGDGYPKSEPSEGTEAPSDAEPFSGRGAGSSGAAPHPGREAGSSEARSVSTPLERLRQIGQWLKDLWDRTKKLLQRLSEILTKLPDLPEQTSEKLEALAGKIQGIFEILEKYEMKEAIGDVKAVLQALLHHYRFRKIGGSLRYGTGDPASTGQLTGVLCLLLPARSELVLTPEFTEAVWEADVTFSGHIRICHVAGAAWHVFRNKRLMRILRFLRRRKAEQQE